jgi:hypothetical protein
MTADELTVARDIDASEIAVVTDWITALDPGVASAYGARLSRFGGAVAMALPGTDTLYFNRVIGLGVFEEASRATVRDIAARYREEDTRFMVHLSPYARPAELPDWLAAEGLAPQGEWITSSRDTSPVDDYTTDLRVEPADRSRADLFARTLCSGYGMPDEWADLYECLVGRDRWTHYLALDGDHPVGTSSLFVHTPFAWCGNSSTLPAYRRRGVHTALNRVRLRAGIAAGVTTFTGETWHESGRINQSLRNHMRDGWRLSYIRTNYAEPLDE